MFLAIQQMAELTIFVYILNIYKSNEQQASI